MKMVSELTKEGKAYYQCEECSFTYDEREIADSCEDWCKKHQSCNLEITRKAVILDDLKPRAEE